jgi:hypothetical protein
MTDKTKLRGATGWRPADTTKPPATPEAVLAQANRSTASPTPAGSPSASTTSNCAGSARPTLKAAIPTPPEPGPIAVLCMTRPELAAQAARVAQADMASRKG